MGPLKFCHTVCFYDSTPSQWSQLNTGLAFRMILHFKVRSKAFCEKAKVTSCIMVTFPSCMGALNNFLLNFMAHQQKSDVCNCLFFRVNSWPHIISCAVWIVHVHLNLLYLFIYLLLSACPSWHSYSLLFSLSSQIIILLLLLLILLLIVIINPKFFSR